MTTTPSEDFLRGVEEGIAYFEGYFRNEDDNLTIEERVETDEGPDSYEMRSITEADIESYRKGAIFDATYEEKLRIERVERENRAKP